MLTPILDDKTTDWITRALRAYGQIAVLAGSAISIWKPSSLPTAPALRDAIINSLFRGNHLLADLQAELEHQLLKSPANVPIRLETVLDEIDQHVAETIPRCISVLATGEPNLIHHAIADWIMSGRVSVLYTTNQDTLVERALESRGAMRDQDFTVATPATPRRLCGLPIIKLHGTIDDPKSIRTTFTQVGQQLPPRMTEELEENLSRYPFLVIGYSGQDLDIRPCFFRAKLCDVFWIEKPGMTNDTHLARALNKGGQNITLHEVDLFLFPVATRLENGSELGKDRAFAIASQVAVQIPAGKLALICSRLVFRSAESSAKIRLQKQCLMRAARTPEVSDSPNLRWRIPRYRGEENRLRSTFFFRNIAAVCFCQRSAREARHAGNWFGQITGLCEAGESMNMFGLGLSSTAYGLGLRFYFRPALFTLRWMRKPPKDTGLVEWASLKDLVHFDIARAYLGIGKYQKAEVRMRRLASTSVSSSVRGHCHRFLALCCARKGDFSPARDHLDQASEHFRYLEKDTETADVLRNRASVELLDSRFPDAMVSARTALAKYRSGRIRRGEVRARVLLSMIMACQRLPSLISSRIFKRIVTGL